MPFLQVTGKRPSEDDPDVLEDYTASTELTGAARLIFTDASGYSNLEFSTDPAAAGVSKVEVFAEDPTAPPPDPPVRSGKNAEK